MSREFKSFPFKIQSVDQQGEFEGYASAFGNVDLGNDVVVAGAFAKTLLESQGGKIPILDHHDPAKQIGWNLGAREDGRGLFVRGKLDLNVQLARERHSLMRMASAVGGRTGLSIGYQTVKSEPDKTRPKVRRLKEVKLFEYSLVVFPMNPEAAVTRVKMQKEMVEQFLRCELGLDEAKTVRAWEYMRSLMGAEPDGRSVDMAPLLRSLKKVVCGIRN